LSEYADRHAPERYILLQLKVVLLESEPQQSWRIVCRWWAQY